MSKPLTKRKLLTVFKTQQEIANKLKVCKSYVSRWPDDEAMPHYQELRLRHEVMTEINWDAIANQ